MNRRAVHRDVINFFMEVTAMGLFAGWPSPPGSSPSRLMAHAGLS